MLTLLIANLIILPVAISFFYDDLRAHWIVFNSISDAVFIADIAVKFRTGIISQLFIYQLKEIPKSSLSFKHIFITRCPYCLEGNAIMM